MPGMTDDDMIDIEMTAAARCRRCGQVWVITAGQDTAAMVGDVDRHRCLPVQEPVIDIFGGEDPYATGAPRDLAPGDYGESDGGD